MYQLILWSNKSKIGKCQNKISKTFIKYELSNLGQHIKSKCRKKTHSIGSDTETIELLNPRDIKHLRDQSYKILHIRAI